MKNNRAKCGRAGYTLMEMMLVVAIIGIIAALGAPLWNNMTNFWRQSSARSDIGRDVRASLDIINRMVRQARQSTVVIDQVSGQPPYSRITFTTISGQTISFYQTGNILYQKFGSNVSKLSRNVGYIGFTPPQTTDTTIISVAFTAQAATYKGGKKELQLAVQKVRIMN